MKVLYNNQYGGFGISLFAVLKLMERDRNILAVYKRDSESSDTYTRVKPKDAQNIRSWLCRSDLIFTENCRSSDSVSQKYIDEHPDIIMHPNKMYEKFGSANNLRFNKKLIALFEKYGSEKISDESAKLEIEEVPKGWMFKIEERDGLESIHQFCPDEDCYYAYE